MNEEQRKNFAEFERFQKAQAAARQKSMDDYEKSHRDELAKNEKQYAAQLAQARRPNEQKIEQAQKQNTERLQTGSQPHAEKLATARREDAQKQAQSKEQNTVPSKKNLAPAKNELKKARQALKGIVKSPMWIIAFAAAIATDICDVFVIAAWPIVFFVRPFLFIFLLMHGSWGRKITRVGATLLDFVPVVGFLPISTLCIIDAYIKSQEKKNS